LEAATILSLASKRTVSAYCFKLSAYSLKYQGFFAILKEMLISVLKSKIHMATVTDTHPYYEGSIAIDKKLIKAAGLVPGEKVHVLNFDNSHRFETYVIEGRPGEISLRGPAAKLGHKGEKVVIIAYALATLKEAKALKAKIVKVNGRNEVK
jgi:aspartate 1-decarboxylase